MKKLTIEDMHVLAKSRGFECISTVYKDSKTELQWKCDLKHKWLAKPNDIQQGKGCPKCSNLKHISEEKCRFIIEQLTGYKFPSDWKTLGNRQQIDGFNEILEVGFEFQGEQHYKNHRKTSLYTEKKFKNIRKRDKKKKNRINYLKKSGKIKDIVFIKYTQRTSDDKLTKYIIKQLNKIDLYLIKNTKIDWSGFYKYLSPLNEIKEIIKKGGGTLISKDYYNNNTKVEVDCGRGHIFKMTSSDLKSGKWCPHCFGNAKLTIKQMQEFAKQNNGTCDSDVYTNNSTKMKWGCNLCGNKRVTSYGVITQCKYFCKICRNNTFIRK